MTRNPNRTRPLDRDGDGRDGGSLPGNKTAPMTTADGDPHRPDDGPPNAQQTAPPLPDAADDLADARTTPGDSAEKLEAIERETDEANAAARAAGGDALAALAEAEPDLVAQVIEDHAEDADTFTAEEVEAAGELPATETETAQIAVRARELRLLVESRRLYKSAEGYSATYGAPFVDQATVDGWIAAGLAEDVPTAGICGGIKPTHEARRHLGQLTLGHYAPGTIGATGEDAA